MIPALASAVPQPSLLTGDLKSKWMEINYYHPASHGYTTEIINPDYFMAPEGQTSPDAEFTTFTDIMKAYEQKGSKPELLCAFPARVSLITKYVPEFQHFQRPDCSKFPRYADPAKVRSVSLVFASGYFESPASYFGHTMLKFNTSNEEFTDFFFDSSLNYGAKITDSTSNPMYVVRGLTGGYVASYSRNNDFINTHSYTNKQMRDIWEYPLKLTANQRTFMVEHSTELKRARFKYYFLNDNCANRISRIIEMATDRKMVDGNGVWLLPIQVVQELNQPKDGPSLFGPEVRYPSLKSQVRDEYLELSPADQQSFANYMTADTKKQEQLVPSLSGPTLALVMDQLDVEAAKLSSKAQDADKLAKLQPPRRIALHERLVRPISATTARPTSTTVPEGALTPATLKHPASIQLGYTARSGDDGMTLRYQASNNDLLTTPFEGQEVSRFIMGAAEVELRKDDLDLRRVTLVDIASLNTNPLPTSVTGEYSWSLKAGYGPRNNICDKCSTISLDGKIGKAVRVNKDLLLYSLVGGQVNHKETAYNDILMLTNENGALYNFDAQTKLLGEVNAEISPIHGNPAYLFKATLAHDLSPQTDIRFLVENDGHGSAAMVKLGFYFN